ncbi:MAG: hypothetical protein K6B70_02205 [Clostridia bacterium]|nr:hypothetical protein [Clostridia bacterium]
MYKEKQFNRIIKQICQEKNIQYEELSDDWIIKLKKENKNKFLVGYKFDLNTQATAEICNDKFALYAVLESEGIQVIKHNIIFKNEESKLNKYFNEYNNDVVLKPNNGTCGNNVLHICDFNKLKDEYNRLINKCYSVDICPFYNIENEYRIIYLPNKQYIYKKIKPIITGDGIHTVRELLIDFNKEYFSKEENLKNENVSADYVPALGEIIEYEWRFNLSKGAKIGNVDDKEKEILMEIVKKIVEVIDVKFVSIDIVKLTNNQYMVMEINSGVMMENLIKLQENGEQIAKDLYENAIDLMFNLTCI